MAAPSNDNTPVDKGITDAEQFEHTQIIDRGVERARDRRENKELMSSNKASHTLVIEHLQPIMDAIDAEMEKCRRLPGSTARWVEAVEKVALLDTAYLAYMCCIDGHDKEWSMNTLRINIGKGFVGLAFEAALNETNEGRNIAINLANNAQNKTKFEHRQDYVHHVARKRGFDMDTWEENNNSKMHEVGAALVTCVEAAVGNDKSDPRVFEPKFEYRNEDSDHRQWYLRLTEEFEAKLEQELINSDYLSPYFSPTIAKPRPWDSDQIGPYMSLALNGVVKAIKHASPEQKKQLDAAMRDGSMKDALHALNLLQETPYDINMFVVDAVDWVRKRGVRPPGKEVPQPQAVRCSKSCI